MKINNKNQSLFAAVSSLFFSGLGQLYNGDLSKGLFIILFSFIGFVFFIFGSIVFAYWILNGCALRSCFFWALGLVISGLVIIVLLSSYSIVDAYKSRLRGKSGVM